MERPHVCFFIPLILIWFSFSSQGVNATRKIFMEYLGAEGYPVAFEEVPINNSTDFFFILSFVVDADEDGKPQNGIFHKRWSEEITPESIKKIKSKHENVKVLMSLGGWSVYTSSGKDKILYWYDPKNIEEWIQNAYNSLLNILKEYSLDGIDIDYESFHIENTTFGYCIGELITRLKANDIIKYATIAPFHEIDTHYMQLYTNYSSVINYVNYQFYTTNKPPSVAQFVTTYHEKAAMFDVEKTLVSLQVYDRGIQGEDFFKGVKQILNETQGILPGIFIWSLDMSVKYKTNFWYEAQSQAVLDTVQTI